MDTCEVLVVGGGPAGSTCARQLRQAGLDVLLLDRARFPRDKPCAGWITPAVLEALAIDSEEYRQGRVLQDIRNFRTGIIDGPEVITRYDKTVSYGIRRSEFDQYLLQRSAARQVLGEPVTLLERQGAGWVVNGHIRTRLLVGAGGHQCPVARVLGAKIGKEPVIVAQAAEFALSPEQESQCPIPADTPCLFFCRDLQGYGWLLRKERFLNIGLGRLDRRNLHHHMSEFCAFLEKRKYLQIRVSDKLQGHAYLYGERRGGRRRVGDGALLIGDAAGLAHAQSGEGILPAIESALMAAATILAANGDYRRDNLEPYAAKLASRYGSGSGDIPAFCNFPGLRNFIGTGLLANRWFTRHVVLDRWFLHINRNIPYAVTH